MKDRQNFKWTKKDIAHQYKYENPDLTWKECWWKAGKIYDELNKMNNQMWKENKVYFKYNKPFSFFDDKDGEFSDTYYDWNS